MNSYKVNCELASKCWRLILGEISIVALLTGPHIKLHAQTNGCVPAPPGIVAWWRAESNALDSVGINNLMLQFPFVPNSGGATGLTYGRGKVGAAFATNTSIGPGPTVIALPSEALDVGAADGFTVEGWIKHVPVPTGVAAISQIHWTDGLRTTGVELGVSASASQAYAFARLVDTNTPERQMSLSVSAQPNPGGWQHVALTFDHATGLALLYLNGTNVTSDSQSAFTPLTKTPVYLAAGPSGPGVVDEVSIYRRTLSAQEIASIYLADVSGKCEPPPPPCVPAPAGMVGWWRGESNSLDTVSGTYGNILLSMLYTNGIAGSCFQFTNGWIRVPASLVLDVGPGPGLTVEFWVNPAYSQAILDGSYASLFSWRNGTNSPGVNLGIAAPSTYYLGGTPLLRANLADSLGHSNIVTSPIGLRSASSWQHVALTYDKASGEAALYLDGHPVTRTNLGSFNPNTTGEFWIGRQPVENVNGKPIFFTGMMDEIAVYNRALTESEVASIVATRGSGKCADAPTIIDQPQSLTVNAGQPASFSVMANGTSILHYQWLFDGLPIPDATNAVFMLASAQTNDSGLYAVIVSNQVGVVTSSNAQLRVNLPPIADPSATMSQAISCNGSNAAVVLDGSKSSDPDGDTLHYAWFENNMPLATGVVAVVQLSLGTNSIKLQVSDGFATNEQTTAVVVITTVQAAQQLINRVNIEVAHPQPLVAILTASLNSINRGQCVPAIAQLRAFQSVVKAQVARQDPALAASLTAAAEQIIQSIESCCEGHGNQKLSPRIEEDHGQPRIGFSAISGRLYLVEASNDLVHWQKIGVSTDHNDGNFNFQDNSRVPTRARFYRIVPVD